MNKFIVFSDLHCHDYREFDKDGSRLENTLEVLDCVFYAADLKECSAILFAGDLFDKYNGIPTKVINKVHARLSTLFTEYPNLNIYAISGNHDQASKNTLEQRAETALTFLEQSFPLRFVVLTHDTYAEVDSTLIFGIEYFDNADYFNACLAQVSAKVQEYDHKAKILLIHQTPKSDSIEFAYEVDPADPLLSAFDYVFCGHIHARDLAGNNETFFTVVGSPLHRDRSDENTPPKGILLLDGSAITIIKTDFPEFRTLPPNSEIPDDGHYYTVQQEIKQQSGQMDEAFATHHTPETLLRNYFYATAKQTESTELLEFGLQLLK